MLFLIILRVSVFPDFLKIKSAFNINIVTIIKKTTWYVCGADGNKCNSVLFFLPNGMFYYKDIHYKNFNRTPKFV